MSAGADVAAANSKAAGAAAASTGFTATALAACFGAGSTRSMAASATTPKANATLTQPSEIRQIRVNFIVSPTLPLE
jgi:hypothetical protein